MRTLPILATILAPAVCFATDPFPKEAEILKDVRVADGFEASLFSAPPQSNYPVFIDGTCAPASPTAQFGTWGNVITITMYIDCATPARPSTWGHVKSIYRKLAVNSRGEAVYSAMRSGQLKV